MEEVGPPGVTIDFDDLADDFEGHRVTVGGEAHEIVVGHDPRVAGVDAEARLALRGP